MAESQTNLKELLDFHHHPVQFYVPSEEPCRDYVQFIWQVRRKNQFQKEIIVPKGIVEIIFNFSTEMKFKADLYGSEFFIPRCFVQGYHTGPIHLHLPESHFLFGVVLNTAGAKQILGLPPGELVQQCIDLTLVESSFDRLWHHLAEIESFQERTMVFTNWIMSRLSALSNRDHAFNALFSLSANRKLSVPSISNWLCYSPRQLSRKFYQLTGMNAEQTLLYLKYLKAKRLIHTSDLSLSQIAYSSGFSDQSHCIKTFKIFTQLSPKEYRKIKSEFNGHYFENVR